MGGDLAKAAAALLGDDEEEDDFEAKDNKNLKDLNCGGESGSGTRNQGTNEGAPEEDDFSKQVFELYKNGDVSSFEAWEIPLDPPTKRLIATAG